MATARLPDRKMRIQAQLTRFAKGMALVGAVGLLIAGAGVLLDVFFRWTFNAPIKGVQDLSRYAIAVATTSFFPIGLIRRDNVAATFLGNALGKRATLWLDAFASIVVLVVVSVLVFNLGRYGFGALEKDLRMITLEWPQAPWWLLAAAIFATALPIQLWVSTMCIWSAIINRNILTDDRRTSDGSLTTATD